MQQGAKKGKTKWKKTAKLHGIKDSVLVRFDVNVTQVRVI